MKFTTIDLLHEAELFARTDWLRRAQQVALLRHLEQCETEAEREAVHKMIRDAKQAILVQYGDPRDHAESGTFKAMHERIGSHESVGMWADLDLLQSEHADRLVRDSKKRARRSQDH